MDQALAFSAISLEWLDPHHRLDPPAYAEALLDRMQAIGTEVFSFLLDSGGYPLFDSELAPKDAHVGPHDLVALLRDGARRRGMRFFLSLFGIPNKYVAAAYPQWRMRDREGRIMEWMSTLVCPNSPYTDWLARLVAESIRLHDPDGVYLEGTGMPTGFCYCGYCRERFRRQYGRPIPEVPAAELVHDRAYMDFLFATTTRFVHRIGAAIKSANPRVLYEVSVGNIGGADFRDLAPHADAVSIERPWGYGGYMAVNIPLWELGLHTQMLRAETRSTVVSSMYVCRNADKDYASRSDDHLRLNYLGLLSHGATPQLHTQNTFDESSASVAVMAELNAFQRRLRPWLAGARIAADAALLDWADPRDVAVRMAWSDFSRHSPRAEFTEPDDRTFLTPVGNVYPGCYLDDSFRGYWRALREHHVPVRVISAEDIREGGLAGIPALVLANAERIDDATAEAIREWVSSGGGLVLTYRSGTRDGAGARRAGPGLAALAGVGRVFGEATHPIHPAYVPHDVSPPQVYYRVASPDPAWAPLAGRLSSFMGSYVEFEAGGDAAEIASVVDYDYGRMHPAHSAIGWYPWKPVMPLAVGRDLGRGRVVYIGAELDGASLRFGDPESLAFLVSAVRWASRGASCLEVEAPPSVEVVVHAAPAGDRWAVLLVNQTTNQHYPDPVRYIVPVHDVKVRLRVGRRTVAGVETASGGTPAWKQDGEWLEASLAKLATYEALLVSARPR